MRGRAVRAVLLLALLASIATLSYVSSRWWKQRQRQKAVAVYIQKTSPVTLRMPKDTTIYLSFYRLRQLYSSLEKTRFNRVLAHWMDMGMKDDEENANPVLGGMLEKMLLNVLGEEVGIALIVGGHSKDLDFVAVAQLAQGSDFLVRLALSQNKKLAQLTLDDSTVYSYQTKDPRIPVVYLIVDSDFAIISNDLERLKAARVQGKGPDLLRDSEPLPLPERTFFFARSAAPALSITAHSEGNSIHIQLTSAALITGALPAHIGGDPAIELLSNAPRLVGQPSVDLAIHNIQGMAATSRVFAYQDNSRTEAVRTQLEERYTEGMAEEQIEELKEADMNCIRFPHHSRSRMLCSRGQLLMEADGLLDPFHLLDKSSIEASQKRPLTVRIQFNKQAVREFRQMADQNNWSRFSTSRPLYFLVCFNEIRGGFGSGQDEIVLEFE